MSKYQDLLIEVAEGYTNYKIKPVHMKQDLDERIETDIARAFAHEEITEDQYEMLIILEGRYKHEL